MTYKSLSLAALLLPLSGYCVNKETRIKDLKEARFKKFAEIKTLGDTIIGYQRENDELLTLCVKKMYEEVKTGSISHEDAKGMVKKEIKRITVGKEFENAYNLSQPFNFSLRKEVASSENLCEYKPISVHYTVVFYFILLNLDKYDQLLQELLEINKELNNLLNLQR